ncbi:MAG: hypothetical protein A2X47_01920 [Lentisphaerae bacterium GWF2_38_69]|nr:MAG: hypothetical protein A2X47_01920 [Lentisphaerae bacterium GWF2_38_69]
MLLAVVAIVAVGVGCFSGMVSVYKNLYNARESYFSKCRMADFWIELKKLPIVELEQIEKIDGISELYSRINKEIIVDLEDVKTPISGRVISLPSVPTPVINNIILKRGSYFSDSKLEEVIVSEKFSQKRNILPGTYINLIMDGIQKKLYVVGTAISSEYMFYTPPGRMAPDDDNYGVFWIKKEFADNVFNFSGACNEIVGILSPDGKKNARLVTDIIKNKLDKNYGVFLKTLHNEQESCLMMNSELQQLRIVAVLMPLIFLCVAVFVLNIQMMRTAEHQRTVIGTLKALGVSLNSISMHFIKLGIIIGLSGGIIGSCLGYFIAEGFTEMYRDLYTFPSIENGFYPELITFSILLAIFFSVLGTLRGIRRMALLSPAEAMRPGPPESCTSIALEKYKFFWSKLDFRWQMVLRSFFRNKRRTMIGIATSALGSVILLLSLGFKDSLNYLVRFQFEKVLTADCTISFRDNLNEGALREASRLPGTTYAEPGLDVPGFFYFEGSEKRGSIIGVKPDSILLKPRDSKGEKLKIPPVGLLMNNRLAEILGVKEGDTVLFKPIKGERKSLEIPIMALSESSVGMPVYADYEYINKLIGEISVLTSVRLKEAQTDKQKDKFYRELKKYPELSSYINLPEERVKLKRDFISKMDNVVYGMILFAGILFFGSILNSAMISTAERTREIAAFRVIGYHSEEVGAIFLREILIINSIGTLLGLPLGYLLLMFMADAFQNEIFSIPLNVYFPTWFYVIGLALTFMLTAYFFVKITIDKLKWNESLQVKE